MSANRPTKRSGSFRFFHPIISLRQAIGCVFLMVLMSPLGSRDAPAAERPHVLFIAIDDLNHWVGHLGRNPQTLTPNVDRLAGWGVSFAHAYCAAPACNPSRTALMSGMRPSTTGVYHNPDDYRPYVQPQQTLNSHFRAHGYLVAGAGKIYHGGPGRRAEWDDYGNPQNPREGGAFRRRNVGGLRWAQLQGDDAVLRDYHTVDYCLRQLEAAHDRPFFVACGIFRPHMPWNVPKKYFDMHPLDQIQLPPYREDDLTDLPPAAVRMAGADGDHARIQQAGAWKEAIQAYLASITYADAQLGRLLDGLEKSRYKDNTIIVLWGDHGWHLGEKHHWRKFALWEEATRAPLIWVVPGVTQPGRICPRPVDFLSIYPTLCDLAELPRPSHVEGVSLRPLLENPEREWSHPAVTTHGYQNHAVRSESWRYIRYENGDEELYNEQQDPYEWTNLAQDPQYEPVKADLAKWLPQENKSPNEERGTRTGPQ